MASDATLEMASQTYLRLLALMTIVVTSVAAQRSVTPPDMANGLVVVPLHEAEEHLLEHKPPTYPPLAKLAKIEGEVRLTLQVNSNGTVVSVMPMSGHPLLVQASIDAAKQYRYRPFEVGGMPANALVDALVSFSLFVPTPHVPFPDVLNISLVGMEYDEGRFRLRVSGSGRVEYTGISYVLVEGKHERWIEPEEVFQLVDAFRKADFFRLAMITLQVLAT